MQPTKGIRNHKSFLYNSLYQRQFRLIRYWSKKS